jgi:AcrR family transcriptional regulator
MNQHSSTDKESIGDRLAIVQEAIDLYLTDEVSYTVHNLADRLEVNPSDIYAYYPNKNARLDGYYTLLLDRYRLMIEEI